MLQSLLELRGMPNPKTTCTHESWNDSHFAHSFWACKLTYFSKFTLIIACYFGSTCIRGKFFFPSVSLHNNFILHQNKIFCVNDAKTWPRLNSVKESANLRKPQTKKMLEKIFFGKFRAGSQLQRRLYKELLIQTYEYCSFEMKSNKRGCCC